MKPSVARARFNAFLRTNVAEHAWSSHTIDVFPRTPHPGEEDEEKVYSVLQRFESLIQAKAPTDGQLWYITQEQFESCIEELITHPPLCSDEKTHIAVNGTVEVTEWRDGSKRIRTKSVMTLVYGTAPWISSMFLKFESREVYEHVKQGFIDAELCKLNDKHLKGR